MNTFTLENKTLTLIFSSECGILAGLSSKLTGWEILNRPHLGLSFRLLLPLPGRRNNPVFGEKQKLTALEIGEDGRTATFFWDGVTSEYGGDHAIRLTARVTLTDFQAVFSIQIENYSDYIVENVYYPYLGDVQHVPGDEWLRGFLYDYATAHEWPIWPEYRNLRGYHGMNFPTQFSPWSGFAGTPMSPFFLLRGQNQGLYTGAVAPESELMVWHTELRPGWSTAMTSQVPENLTISGKNVATRFAAVHVPFLQPGESRILIPVAMQAYQGDWHAGVDIYKTWRSGWMTKAAPPEWARQPHSWQVFQLNSPEDDLRMPFKNLVKVGEDCARQGIKALHLIGWNNGGQDQGNPSHDPDPRLGNLGDLKEAIVKIQAMGVKVILFTKFTWADRATEWFRKDLVRLSIKDPYGDYYLYPGYQYQTATQLLDINTKRLIPMCFLSEEYQHVCENEFQKILDLGASGMLFDEALHHPPALLCFDNSHGHRYGAPVYANDRKLAQRFKCLSEPVNPDFLYAAEACYDWMWEAYPFSLIRTESLTHIPLSRYLMPDGQIMTTIVGFNERNMINQALMYRYILSYEPYFFKGRLDDFPLTLAYGKQMDALRTELRDYFWDGEFCDTVGAVVTNRGKLHSPYSLFINHQKTKSGLVICNYNEKDSIVVQAILEDGEKLERYRLVDNPSWQDLKKSISIPPLSSAVVI